MEEASAFGDFRAGPAGGRTFDDFDYFLTWLKKNEASPISTVSKLHARKSCFALELVGIHVAEC